MTTTAEVGNSVAGSPRAFRRAICGIDGSLEAAVAAKQAARLLEAGAHLLLLAAIDPWDVILTAHGDLDGTRAHLIEDAEEALLEARRELAAAAALDVRADEGSPLDLLLKAIAHERADLVAVGYHGLGRLHGFMSGSVATILLHRAPCSVLVGRPSAAPLSWPSRIVAGIDGTPRSTVALHAARMLASRLGADLQLVTATGDRRLDQLAAERQGSGSPHELDPRPPVHALVDRSSSADLLVLGSRGVRGLDTIGSVSERVAHRSACSVLVVR